MLKTYTSIPCYHAVYNSVLQCSCYVAYLAGITVELGNNAMALSAQLAAVFYGIPVERDGIGKNEHTIARRFTYLCDLVFGSIGAD